MRSTAGSTRQSANAVRRAAVVTHGNPETIGPGLARLERAARDAGVELGLPRDGLAKHGRADREGDPAEADLAVVLGGDGTMLRALRRLLGCGVPAIGVNFGSVGFLATIDPSELEDALARVFAGDYRVVELATIEAELGRLRRTAVNDVVAASSVVGRMVKLAWAVGGEDLGVLPCDGVICATPVGSTGYNLSNGGPVMVWGLDAMVVTFIAPHSLDARPLVAPRGRDVEVCNMTPDGAVTVLADGHAIGVAAPGECVRVGLGAAASLLATLPEATFFTRYRATFGAS